MGTSGNQDGPLFVSTLATELDTTDSRLTSLPFGALFRAFFHPWRSTSFLEVIQSLQLGVEP